MNIEKSSLQTPVGYGSTSSIREQLLESLQASKEYRHAFLQESISSRITAQIKALRDAHGCDYKGFAELINKKVSWAYRLEDPNAAPPTIPTLLEIAQAFDIALDVRFSPFSALVNDVSALSVRSFIVPSFDQELKTGSFSVRRRRRRNRRSNVIHILRKPHEKANSMYGSKGVGGTVSQDFAVL